MERKNQKVKVTSSQKGPEALAKESNQIVVKNKEESEPAAVAQSLPSDELQEMLAGALGEFFSRDMAALLHLPGCVMLAW